HHIRLGTLTKKQSTTRPRKHRQAATQGKKRTRQSQRLTRSRITHTTRNRWPKRIRQRNRYHLPALYGNPERMARQITQCPPATHRRTHFSLLNPPRGQWPEGGYLSDKTRPGAYQHLLLVGTRSRKFIEF